jgi:hypothetical protein
MRGGSQRLLCTVLVAFCAACAGNNPRQTHEDRDLLTKAQVDGQGFTNLYDAVEALRSNWLTARGPDTILGTPTEVIVYFDATRLGGVETLRWIAPGDVVYIRHYDGKDATSRWGVGHGQGVIFVSTHPM